MFNFKREIISKPILAGSQRLQRWRGDYQPPQNRIYDANNDNEIHNIYRPWARELRIDMPRAPKTKHRGSRHTGKALLHLAKGVVGSYLTRQRYIQE